MTASAPRALLLPPPSALVLADDADRCAHLLLGLHHVRLGQASGALADLVRATVVSALHAHASAQDDAGNGNTGASVRAHAYVVRERRDSPTEDERLAAWFTDLARSLRDEARPTDPAPGVSDG